MLDKKRSTIQIYWKFLDWNTSQKVLDRNFFFQLEVLENNTREITAEAYLLYIAETAICSAN